MHHPKNTIMEKAVGCVKDGVEVSNGFRCLIRDFDDLDYHLHRSDSCGRSSRGRRQAVGVQASPEWKGRTQTDDR